MKKCHTALITIASFALVGDAITRNLIAYAISENNRLNFLTKNVLSMFKRQMSNMRLPTLHEKKNKLLLFSSINEVFDSPLRMLG